MIQTISIPVNDSAAIPFRIQLANGTYQDLTGYTVTLTIRTSVSAASPLITPITGVLRVGATTYCDITIPQNQLTSPGAYVASIVAVNTGTGDHHTAAFNLQVTAHA
jgi:hypothetical protein